MVAAGAVFLPAFPRQGLSETTTAPAASAAKADTKIETSPAPEKKDPPPALGILVSKENLEAKVAKPEAARETAVSQEPVAEQVTKTMYGEVSGHGFNGLAVTYNQDAKRGIGYEAWFNYEDDTKFSGYKEKKEIEDGDTVEVTYEQPEQDGKKILKQVRLLKKRPPEVEVDEEPSAEDRSTEEAEKG